MNLSGKTVLILGASENELSLVERAHHFGLRVIVTDNHSDWAEAPAKLKADIAWNVSWSDLDALEDLCRANDVDGVVAGYSELRVENQIKLCQRLGLPCYSTLEQLEITRNKRLFKETCRKYGLPVVNEYNNWDCVTHFPVIVKPVDRGGSIGISVAHTSAELEKSWQYAMNMSVCKDVIIEDYIENCTKVDFMFTICDGEAELAAAGDTLHSPRNDGKRVIQNAWLYPTQRLELAKKTVVPAMRRMMAGLGMRNGYMFFSAFYVEPLGFVFFECGFRLGGGHQYEYMYRQGFLYSLDVMIFHALTGSGSCAARNPLGNNELKCVTVNYYAKAGIVTEIMGVSEIKDMRDCSAAVLYARKGLKCLSDAAILQKLAMFSFCNVDEDELRRDVEKANSTFKVMDEQGNDMIYDRIEPVIVSTWWH